MADRDGTSFITTVADRHNVSAPGPNTGILATAITPGPQASMLRVTVQLATASVFVVSNTRSAVTKKGKLNGGTALVANGLYTFTIPVTDASTYNFEVETDGVIAVLLVDEIRGGAT